jgi:hypothetical protein
MTMNDKLCGNCKHWSQDSDDIDPPYGECKRIKMKGAIREVTVTGLAREVTLENEKACTVDGSDYFSAILCRSDFGCVLWEQRP